MHQESRLLPQIPSWSAWHRDRGQTVGFVNGAFDLLHEGHRWLLQVARANCDWLLVGVNSDASVKLRKGESRPVQTAEARLRALYDVCGIDAGLVFDANDPGEILQALKPDFYFLGSDYRGQSIPGAEFCGQVLFVERLPGISTTSIVNRNAGQLVAN